MMQEPEKFDVVVIGAGIGGLTCGYELMRSGLRVLVADGHDEPGGVIRSGRTNGYLLEFGPNSFAMSRPGTSQILNDLGLESQVQSRVMKDHVRYVWRNQHLCPVPSSLSQFLGTELLSAGEKLRAAAGLFRWLPPPQEDVKAGAYFRPRVGDGVVEAMVRPAVAGIYAADVDHISLEATFPKVFASARQHGRLAGVLKGLAASGGSGPSPRSLASFDEGLQTLPRALAAAISAGGGEVALGENVHLDSHDPLDCEPGGSWSLEFTSGRRVCAGQVVIAAGAGATAQLLKTVAEESAAAFSAIEYAPLAVVHVGAGENQFWERREGFGFLTARDSALRILGMVWSDRVFDGRAPEGNRLLTCFYGGELDPDAVGLSDGKLEQQVRADLRSTMGLVGGFDLFRVTRWRRAIPLFRLGHAGMIQEAEKKLPAGIHLLGSYLGDPSIPGRMQAGVDLAHGIAWNTAVEVG